MCFKNFRVSSSVFINGKYIVSLTFNSGGCILLYCMHYTCMYAGYVYNIHVHVLVTSLIALKIIYFIGTIPWERNQRSTSPYQSNFSISV